jgi:hypothetical protein
MSRRDWLGRCGFLTAALLLPTLAGCSGPSTPSKSNPPSSTPSNKELPKGNGTKDAEPIKPPTPDPGN